MYTLAAIALCLTGVLGVWLIWYGWRDRRDRTKPSRQRKFELSTRQQLYLLAGAAAGVVAWVVSGWFLCVIAGPAIGYVLPKLFGKRAADRAIDRLVAVEEWLRNLTGVLKVGTNIEQAIIITRRTIPKELEVELGALITRLATNSDTKAALMEFSDEMDDYTADLVCSALMISAQLRASGLPKALQGFAETVSEDVKDRRQVEVDRRGPRTQARIVTVIVIGFLGYLFLGTEYMEPYKEASLQLVLFGLLAGFASLLWYMSYLTRPVKQARFLKEAIAAVRPIQPAALPASKAKELRP
jgi:tight adherence protein B